jgi:hypothetical protein
MKLATVLLLAPALMSSSDIPHQELLGFWKSNEEKTLASMHATPGVTKKAKEMFENNVFGKRVVEYKIDTYRARYENEEDNSEALNRYYTYRVLEKGENYLILEYRIPLVKNNLRRKTIFMDGNCYYELVSRWNFKEFFCRIKP